MYANLIKIIALCELDLISDALKIASDLLKIGMDLDSNKFSGRFFKQTVNIYIKQK